jgi:hypothetical protein
MTTKYATLTVEGDPDGDGTTETGVFRFGGNLEITPSIRTGFITGGRQSQVNSIIANLIDPGQSQNQQFFIDAGAGAHAVEIQFRGFEGAEDAAGQPLEWGNTGDAGQPTATDATGADAITQICCLMQYLLTGNVVSRNPAPFEWGEWATDGLYEPLEVVLEGPEMTKAAEDGSWFDGTLTVIAAADLADAYDAVQRKG